ncbi:hypothetical protein T265_06124 [Opisthorchis viverrini]|uniref:Uncharacterized protein n=1 Tax=Opisthorchis viverrini TaxID=6198 RepID=A0A074ZI98_OPIVI|nr:hypothetical protein T265_06124 [Opisthorchis viverrini]KER26691.1 hypothetical protein T265_06124 [Opisthorchis viverrini]
MNLLHSGFGGTHSIDQAFTDVTCLLIDPNKPNWSNEVHSTCLNSANMIPDGAVNGDLISGGWGWSFAQCS